MPWPGPRTVAQWYDIKTAAPEPLLTGLWHSCPVFVPVNPPRFDTSRKFLGSKIVPAPRGLPSYLVFRIPTVPTFFCVFSVGDALGWPPLFACPRNPSIQHTGPTGTRQLQFAVPVSYIAPLAGENGGTPHTRPPFGQAHRFRPVSINYFLSPSCGHGPIRSGLVVCVCGHSILLRRGLGAAMVPKSDLGTSRPPARGFYF